MNWHYRHVLNFNRIIVSIELMLFNIWLNFCNWMNVMVILWIVIITLISDAVIISSSPSSFPLPSSSASLLSTIPMSSVSLMNFTRLTFSEKKSLPKEKREILFDELDVRNVEPHNSSKCKHNHKNGRNFIRKCIRSHHQHQHQHKTNKMESKNQWRKQNLRLHNNRNQNNVHNMNGFTPIPDSMRSKSAVNFADDYISGTIIKPFLIHSNVNRKNDTQTHNSNQLLFRRRHAKRWNRNYIKYIQNINESMLFENADAKKHFHRTNMWKQNANLMTSKLYADISDVANETEIIHWPVKKEAIMEGDVILGGLMMVHSREDSMMCGPIMPQGRYR